MNSKDLNNQIENYRKKLKVKSNEPGALIDAVEAQIGNQNKKVNKGGKLTKRDISIRGLI